MRYDRIVIGYHGCDAATAELLLRGEPFKPSMNDYDWLGRGIYFWEYGPDRALRFAQEQQRRGKVRTAAVVGALIQLGNCFDLMDTRFTQDLEQAYPGLEALLRRQGKALPENGGGPPDHKLRRRDCAVMNWYLQAVEDQQGIRYDTVRCGFVEGRPLYEGAGIYRESHVQLAVRTPAAIVGVFRPLPTRLLEGRYPSDTAAAGTV
jgi:hypothetical protein